MKYVYIAFAGLSLGLTIGQARVESVREKLGREYGIAINREMASHRDDLISCLKDMNKSNETIRRLTR